jgi:hypothetical protein
MNCETEWGEGQMRFLRGLSEAWALFGPVEMVALAAFLATVIVWAITLATVLR